MTRQITYTTAEDAYQAAENLEWDGWKATVKSHHTKKLERRWVVRARKN